MQFASASPHEGFYQMRAGSPYDDIQKARQFAPPPLQAMPTGVVRYVAHDESPRTGSAYSGATPPIGNPTKKEKDTLRHLKKAEEDLDELRSALQSAQTRLKEREAERKVIKMLKTENNKLQERLSDVSDQLQSETEDRKEAAHKLRFAEEQVNQLQARARALESQLREEVREKEQRHAAVEQLSQEIDGLRKKDIESRRIVSQEEQRRIASLIEENGQLQRRLAEREQQLQDLANWATAAHQQLHDLSSNVNRESAEANSLRSKLRELEGQLVDEMQKKAGLRFQMELARSNEAAPAYQRPLIDNPSYSRPAPSGRLSTYVMQDEPRYEPGARFAVSSSHSSPASFPRTDPRYFYPKYDRSSTSSLGGSSASFNPSSTNYGAPPQYGFASGANAYAGHGSSIRHAVA